MSTSNHNEHILLTGGTGFLGVIVKDHLVCQGYHVTTLGRGEDNDIACDLSREVPVLPESYAWVIHNAGKAHTVPKNEQERQAFFDVNCIGTTNLLTALQASAKLPETIVFISSVSVYGVSSGTLVDENHPLQARDAYGKSKILAESLVTTWCREHAVKSLILRLPLLAGKEPPGNLGMMIKGIKRGFYFRIAGNNSRKSIVMAEDVAAMLPTLAQKQGVFNLTDGYNPSFYELEQVIAKQLRGKKILSIPAWLATALGKAGDILDKIFPHKSPVTSDKVSKMKSTLTFSDLKAQQQLGWKPRQVLAAFEIQ